MLDLDRSLLDQVCTLAENAGKAIMQIYESGEFQAELKSDQSPLTIADKKSNAVICDGLSALDTHYPILSEESEEIPFNDRNHWKTFWLIDPLDGTKEFLKKNGEFTVNIALVHQGKVVLGVVYAPAKNLFYRAAQGLGAEKLIRGNWKKIQSSDFVGERVKVVMSRSHPSKELTQFLNDLENYEAVETGSSLKICYVAEGLADIYPRLGPTMEWDTAAAHCVLNEAKGFLNSMEDESFKYNRPNLRNGFFVAGSQAIASSDLLQKLYEVSRSSAE